jgi:hypothetical protein
MVMPIANATLGSLQQELFRANAGKLAETPILRHKLFAGLWISIVLALEKFEEQNVVVGFVDDVISMPGWLADVRLACRNIKPSNILAFFEEGFKLGSLV